MEDFQGKYNGKQIDQLLDKANDIDLTKYALKTDNAPTATKLQAARTIALSGAVTGSVSSDFGDNVTISTTLANFDASKIASGTISIDRLPKAAEENGLTLQLPANYTAAGKTTTNGAVIADDPGAAGEFVWSITISDVPANVTIEELTATLKVTAAGGQTANVTVTQAAGDSTIELDKETINLDVNGTQQTVNVTSNDSWTWAQAAARTVLRMMGR